MANSIESTDATPTPASPMIELTIDGKAVAVPDDGATLLDTVRELGWTAAKDGCSPQGQCGCCTLLVDGQARVACVTPTRRVRGRAIVTPQGMAETQEWAEALCATGGSQCGFCTPGIIIRLESLRRKNPDADRLQLDRALAAHLCRCTGWNSIVEAWDVVGGPHADRDWEAASARATIEGHTAQTIGPDIAAGAAVFAADTAPDDALVALRRADGEWVVGETLADARRLSAKVQGRRTTLDPHYPVPVPDGDWDITLQTTWTEPAYLETDAAWCAPGGEPASALANGGAFGAKLGSEVGSVARELADRHGRPVRVLYSREDAARLGAKRPPMGAGINRDGTGRVHVARTAGIADAIAAVAPQLLVDEVDIAGPPTSATLRVAGWAEAHCLLAAGRGEVGRIDGIDGGWAEATVAPSGAISVTVNAGKVLDETMLRSYCIGAAHMATGWVRSEAMAVDADGEVHDLTVRSFGVLRAMDTPAISVEIVASEDPPVNGSDAVFAAVAAAVWIADGVAPQWPTNPGLTDSSAGASR